MKVKPLIRYIIFIVLLFSSGIFACPECRPLVEKGVFNQNFSANLLFMLLPVSILLVISALIYFSDDIKGKFRKEEE